MSGGPRPRFSLRTLFAASALAFGALVLGVVVTFWVASSTVLRSARAVEQDAHAVDVTEDVDRALRESHRITNLWITTRDPELQSARSLVDADLRSLLARMEEYVENATEARLVAELRTALTSYFDAREALDAGNVPIEQVIPTLRTSLERALSSSTSLQRYSEEHLQRSQLEAERAIWFARIAAVASTLLVVLGMIVIILGARLLVLRPLFNLQDAVQRFRNGDTHSKALPGPLTETRALADGFNEMTEAIAQQRRDQLTFLAAVAHDLRNPLSGLKMIVQSLEREPTTATADRFRRLDRQLDRLTRMVGDLLDATRIESGQLELQLQEVDLGEAARAIVDLYAPTTGTHRITLHPPEQPLILQGDPLRLEQVIGNLLSNAIKYSPGGGPVEVSLSATDGWAQLSVSDHGVGIPPEELPKLFLPFRRRPATAELTPGMGLGLSIVRRIVNAHGGHIDVESTPNVGSTFRVRLPFEVRTVREVEQNRSAGAAEPDPAHPDPH